MVDFRGSCVRALRVGSLVACGALGTLFVAAGQSGDMPASITIPQDNFDYVRREVMIPMRDGVKLYTVLIIPKGVRNAPMLLTRTPYNAAKRVMRNDSPHM